MSVPVRIAEQDAAQGRQPTTTSTTSKLSDLKIALQKGIRKYPDFPKKGILFEDILPLFSDINLHTALIKAFELKIQEVLGAHNKPDVVVGLDARGFLFGPSIALRVGAGFVPVRKPNKLPGELYTATYTKEYGEDSFAIQRDAIKKGQTVLIVDDLIATGGSAAAAGSLVKQSGGDLLGYIFIIELGFLNGRAKLGDSPFWSDKPNQQSGTEIYIYSTTEPQVFMDLVRPHQTILAFVTLA